jgi:hypothetical protein
MAVRLLALLACQPLFTPINIFCYSFLLEAESTPRAIVRLEGLGKFKKKCNDIIRTRTGDLASCSYLVSMLDVPS